MSTRICLYSRND